MIINRIKKVFSGTVYVQLREEKIRICHIEEKLIYEQRPYIAIDKTNAKKEIVHAIGDDAFSLINSKIYDVSNPFSHPRLLVSSFLKAEKVLMHGIRQVHRRKIFAPAPVVVIHPMEKIEGGVTDVECRLYRELALGAGAREVHLHVGNSLSVSNFSFAKIQEPKNA